mmetsp:Transcript_31862/g.71410  ORF Transcript_31862/g.71410 Transcript_31862/m.71410 type:complete len:242 (+) Transcript_31862:293-1018(+)
MGPSQSVDGFEDDCCATCLDDCDCGAPVAWETEEIMWRLDGVGRTLRVEEAAEKAQGDEFVCRQLRIRTAGNWDKAVQAFAAAGGGVDVSRQQLGAYLRSLPSRSPHSGLAAALRKRLLKEMRRSRERRARSTSPDPARMAAAAKAYESWSRRKGSEHEDRVLMLGRSSATQQPVPKSTPVSKGPPLQLGRGVSKASPNSRPAPRRASSAACLPSTVDAVQDWCMKYDRRLRQRSSVEGSK